MCRILLSLKIYLVLPVTNGQIWLVTYRSNAGTSYSVETSSASSPSHTQKRGSGKHRRNKRARKKEPTRGCAVRMRASTEKNGKMSAQCGHAAEYLLSAGRRFKWSVEFFFIVLVTCEFQAFAHSYFILAVVENSVYTPDINSLDIC